MRVSQYSAASDWNCVPTCAALRSGRRTARRPCRSGGYDRPAPQGLRGDATLSPPASSAAISRRVSARHHQRQWRFPAAARAQPRYPPRPGAFAVAQRSSASTISVGDTASSTCTRQRDSSAEFSSNDGFSVVAPTNRIVPRSMCGRKASCCALLKRCTSSTNSTVRRPRRTVAQPRPAPGALPASRTARRRWHGTRHRSTRPAAVTAWSCRSPAGPTGSSNARARIRPRDAARCPAPAGAFARPFRRGCAGACARPAGADVPDQRSADRGRGRKWSDVLARRYCTARVTTIPAVPAAGRQIRACQPTVGTHLGTD